MRMMPTLAAAALHPSVDAFRYPLRTATAALLLTLGPMLVMPSLADGGAGHEIAERFAKEADQAERRAAERAEQQRRRRIENELKKSETDMLARARAEAANREAPEADIGREAEVRRQAVETERIEAERRTAARRAADEARIAQENHRRIEAERLAVEAAKRDEARRITEAKAAEDARLAAAAEATRREAMARERAAEAERISEVLREAREAHERRRREGHEPQQQAQQPLPPSEPQRETALPRSLQQPLATEDADMLQRSPLPSRRPQVEAGSQRFAVLLVMHPGNRGIRRHNKTADPVLCSDEGCYVSNGPESAASLMHHRKALGFGRTFGGRAGACENSLGCIFRDVVFQSFPSFLQPVDMRIVRHDRREAQSIDGGSDCYLAAGRLSCRRPFHGPDYVMWLVPERMAVAVGSGLLAQAIADGLSEAEPVRTSSPGWR